MVFLRYDPLSLHEKRMDLDISTGSIPLSDLVHKSWVIIGEFTNPIHTVSLCIPVRLREARTFPSSLILIENSLEFYNAQYWRLETEECENMYSFFSANYRSKKNGKQATAHDDIQLNYWACGKFTTEP